MKMFPTNLSRIDTNRRYGCVWSASRVDLKIVVLQRKFAYHNIFSKWFLSFTRWFELSRQHMNEQKQFYIEKEGKIWARAFGIKNYLIIGVIKELFQSHFPLWI